MAINKLNRLNDVDMLVKSGDDFMKCSGLWWSTQMLGLFLLNVACAFVSYADTAVGGPLPNGTTTWKLSASPYRLIQNIEIPTKARLEIEPGVEIRIGNYSIVVNGSLVARGNQQQFILFTVDPAVPEIDRWGSIQFNPSSEKATFESNGNFVSGCLLEYSIIERGQGIIIYGASPTIRNCILRENIKEEGGAILSVDGSPVVQACEIFRNRSERNGGGIRTIGGQPVIRECRIRFNTAIRGAGGGISSDFSNPTILDNNVSHNMAHEGGGIATGIPHGAYLSTAAHSCPEIAGNTIDHNYASLAGGGIFVSGTPRIIRNVISNNGLGYGLLKAGEIEIRTSNFNDRTTTRKNVGAGIFVENTFAGQAIIQVNQIIHNYGAEWGGGLHLNRGSALIESNCFVANEARSGGGGATIVFVREHESPGSLRHGIDTSMVENEFLNNQGGALEFAGNAKHRCLVEHSVFQSNFPVEVINHSQTDVPLSNCQFDTHEPLELQKLVLDRYDHLAYGRLVFDQIAVKGQTKTSELANQWNQSLAVVAPQKLEAMNSIMNVPNTHDLVLQWEPLRRPEVAGYRIYFVDGSTLTHAPFGTGGTSQEGHSPIDVGLEVSTKITGLRANQTYHFAVTAIDTKGNESGFSNIASARTTDNRD